MWNNNLYTLEEAQKIWTNIIINRTKELENDLLNNKESKISKKQKIAYV